MNILLRYLSRYLNTVKNLKIFFCTSLDAQKSQLLSIIRCFCRQSFCVRFSLSGRKQSPDSFDRAPAGGFLVRRPRVSIAGSKGRTVKARAAARRGSLDRLPAFGTFADVTDGEAGIFRDALPCTRPLRNEMSKEIRYATENSPSHVAY